MSDDRLTLITESHGDNILCNTRSSPEYRGLRILELFSS